MNDFSELENELRKLRPAQPSPVLFERVREALKIVGHPLSHATRSDGLQTHNWWSLGFGLAAAAVLILLRW